MSIPEFLWLLVVGAGWVLLAMFAFFLFYVMPIVLPFYLLYRLVKWIIFSGDRKK